MHNNIIRENIKSKQSNIINTQIVPRGTTENSIKIYVLKKIFYWCIFVSIEIYFRRQDVYKKN